MKTYKTIDLFAGIGGIRLGFEKAGFQTVYSNDFDKHCKITYDSNFDNPKLHVENIKNIKSKDLPKYDLLLGGFPCQAFSIAGYREGFKDEKGRGDLFFDIARIIKNTKPEGFMLENVRHLKTHDKGKTFRIISDTLKSLGYYFTSQILNSKDFGNVPQNRERIIIVGFKNKNTFGRFHFPKKKPLTKTVLSTLENKVDEKYYYNNKPLYKKLKKNVVRKDKVYQWRRIYVRENKNGVCPTLTANMGTGGHNVPIIKDNKGIRKLTPRECARLQGFPDSYRLPENIAISHLYKQIGNSVSVPVIESVAKNIKMAMIEKAPLRYQSEMFNHQDFL